MEYLKYNEPMYLDNLNLEEFKNPIEILVSNNLSAESKIPGGCIFLNSKKECMIYDARPLICRTHGVSYLYKDYNNILCSKISITKKNKDEFVNLRSYYKQAEELIYIKYKDSLIYTRTYPIFYWVYWYSSNVNLEKIRTTELYKRYTEVSNRELTSTYFG